MVSGDHARVQGPSGRSGRRFFVPIGVGHPGDVLRELPGVPRDLERMGALFLRRGYTIAPRLLDLSALQLRASLADWLAAVDLGPHDAVVFYFTGHGCVVDGDLYLACRGFSRATAPTTGLKTQDLIELALRRSPRPAKLWLIVDCCAAGGVFSDGLYRALGSSGADAFVLAASDSWSEAFDGSFSRAFEGAVNDAARTPTPTSVSLDQITEAVNTRRVGSRAVQAGISSARFDLLDAASTVAPPADDATSGTTRCR